MKECPSCRRAYSDGVESCPKCFLPLMPKQETRFCPDCHEEIPAHVTRCFHCGGGLEYGPEPDEAPADVDWREVAADELPDADPAPPARPVPSAGAGRRPGAKKTGPGCVFAIWILLFVLIQAVRILTRG